MVNHEKWLVLFAIALKLARWNRDSAYIVTVKDLIGSNPRRKVVTMKSIHFGDFSLFQITVVTIDGKVSALCGLFAQSDAFSQIFNIFFPKCLGKKIALVGHHCSHIDSPTVTWYNFYKVLNIRQMLHNLKKLTRILKITKKNRETAARLWIAQRHSVRSWSWSWMKMTNTIFITVMSAFFRKIAHGSTFICSRFSIFIMYRIERASFGFDIVLGFFPAIHS